MLHEPASGKAPLISIFVQERVAPAVLPSAKARAVRCTAAHFVSAQIWVLLGLTASGSPCADPEYLAFLEELKKEPAALPSAEAQAARRAAEAAAEGSSAPAAALTPLVALMLAQRGRGGQVSFARPLCKANTTALCQYQPTGLF